MPREEIGRASAREVHIDDIKIDQLPPIDLVGAIGDRDPDIILVDSSLVGTDYLAELAFMEEPVTIRLEPSATPNAVAVFAVWCNGQGAEIFENGRWNQLGWLPVDRPIIVKRKILEIIVRTKIDTVHTEVANRDSDHPNNLVQRFTSPVHSFSILKDDSPRGLPWLAEMRRRNF